MTQPNSHFAACATALLVHYSFELPNDKAEELVSVWLRQYPANWVLLAVIEALYQGRYKSISVEQILAFWQRRNKSLPHFNSDFQRLVCRKLPQNLSGGESSELWEVATEELETTLPEVNSQPVESNLAGNSPHPPPPPVPTWSRWNASKYPIHQFTPAASEESTFEAKIKAIAHQEDLPPIEIVSVPKVEIEHSDREARR
jgi:hypothetical protein